MVVLSELSAGGKIHVAILTIPEDDQSHTQPKSRYMIPGGGRVKTTYHTIESNCLRFLPSDIHVPFNAEVVSSIPAFRMSRRSLGRLYNDIEEGRK
jgi:hypothetical protein